MPGDGRTPETEEMLTIAAAAPSASPPRSASCTQPSVPSTLTSSILRAAPRSRVPSGPYAGLMPMLLTSVVTGPN